MQQANDGGYIITGRTYSYGQGNGDAYLIKTASDGSFQWAKAYGKTNSVEEGAAVFQTADGGYAMAGISSPTGGNSRMLLIKTDSNGNSGCNESSFIPVVNSGGNDSTGGTATTRAIQSFTPLTQVGSGGSETILCLGTSINEIDSNNSIHISPNPTTGEIHITNQ